MQPPSTEATEVTEVAESAVAEADAPKAAAAEVQDKVQEIELTALPADMDDDQFVSLWNTASATMDADTTKSRELASKLLGFLCKHRCEFLVISPSDARYLDDWFERDNTLLYNWNADSERVDVVSQHLLAPFDLLVSFLKNHKFKFEKNYSPRRADRVEWFTNDVNVG